MEVDCVCFNISISVYFFLLLAEYTYTNILIQPVDVFVKCKLCQRYICFFMLFGCSKGHFGLAIVTKHVEVNSVCFLSLVLLGFFWLLDTFTHSSQIAFTRRLF